MASSFHLSPAAKARTISPPPLRASSTTQASVIPTMSDIMEASLRSQRVKLQLRTSGPFFRVTAVSAEDERLELGKAVGVVRPWVDGKVLHLDSMRMSKATLGAERSIFGLGLFVGAVAVCHGYNCGCKRAELLAIDDSNAYHEKLVRFYARMGFKAVREVDGSSFADLPHMLTWGGKGTRMDADIEHLMIKWGRRFKPPPPA